LHSRNDFSRSLRRMFRTRLFGLGGLGLKLTLA
jgi:hypothetical protein